MTFGEFMQAAGYEPYFDDIMGGGGFRWRDQYGEERAVMFTPEPPLGDWWPITVRLRDVLEPDSPQAFYHHERFQ